VRTLDLETTKNEIEAIIGRFPNRRGGVPSESYSGGIGYDCVYFHDANGNDISSSSWDPMYDQAPVPVTPVCIVGQWVMDFHPELLQDNEFKDTLMRNSIIGSYRGDALPYEVKSYLSFIQQQQDDGTPWGDLNLDAE